MQRRDFKKITSTIKSYPQYFSFFPGQKYMAEKNVGWVLEFSPVLQMFQKSKVKILVTLNKILFSNLEYITVHFVNKTKGICTILVEQWYKNSLHIGSLFSMYKKNYFNLLTISCTHLNCYCIRC